VVAPTVSPTATCNTIDFIDDGAMGFKNFVALSNSKKFEFCEIVSFVFEAKFSYFRSVLHVIIQEPNSPNGYEIAVKPGDPIHDVVLRRIGDGNRWGAAETKSYTMASADGVHTYNFNHWVQFNRVSGKFTFGTGATVGQQVLLEYIDPQPINVSTVSVNIWCIHTDEATCDTQEAASSIEVCPVESTCAPTPGPTLEPTPYPTPSPTPFPSPPPTASPSKLMNPFYEFYFDASRSPTPAPKCAGDSCLLRSPANSGQEFECIPDCPAANPNCSQAFGSNSECECHHVARILTKMLDECPNAGKPAQLSCRAQGGAFVLTTANELSIPKLNTLLESLTLPGSEAPIGIICSPTGVLMSNQVDTSAPCEDQEDWCHSLPESYCTHDLIKFKHCMVKCDGCPKPGSCPRTVEILDQAMQGQCNAPGSICNEQQRQARAVGFETVTHSQPPFIDRNNNVHIGKLSKKVVAAAEHGSVNDSLHFNPSKIDAFIVVLIVSTVIVVAATIGVVVRTKQGMDYTNSFTESSDLDPKHFAATADLSQF